MQEVIALARNGGIDHRRRVANGETLSILAGRHRRTPRVVGVGPITETDSRMFIHQVTRTAIDGEPGERSRQWRVGGDRVSHHWIARWQIRIRVATGVSEEE